MVRWLSPVERVERFARIRALNEVALVNSGHDVFVKRLEARSVDVYHVPLWEGDFIGQSRQLTMLEVFASAGYAEGERRLLWDLAGHGKAYVDCGKTLVLGCDNVGSHPAGQVFVRLARRNCRRKACPTCFEGWASSEAERALVRLSAFVVGSDLVSEVISDVKKEFALGSARVFHGGLVSRLEGLVHQGRMKPIHVVLSPPVDVSCDTVAEYRVLRSRAYRIAKESGLSGGSVIVHPYRLKCVECGSAIPDYLKECPACGCSRFAWFWSVHFHVVGFGWIVGVVEGFARHGWVVKNLGVRNSVFWTFQYLLSHAGVSNVHTVTWFGKLAYNRMGFVPRVVGFREVCPYCMKFLFPMVWLGGEDRPPPIFVFDLDPTLNDFWVSVSDWKCHHG